MYKILILADGGLSIGMGHIMRCISLGNMFLNKGYEVFFISRYEQGKKVIRENNFGLIEISCRDNKLDIYTECSSNTKELDSERERLINILKKEAADVLIVDHYNVNEKFFLYLKPYVKILAYIDDINAFSYPVDVVVNGNITGEYMNYEAYYPNQKFLLGPKYNLIRDEFVNIERRIISKTIKKIMITTGGSDSFRVTEKLIDYIRYEKNFDNIELHIIIGSSFQNKKELYEKKKQYTNIVLYENVKKISSVMLSCDIAISSCGSTLYELCACGIPTLGFVLADNQSFIAKKMNELGYIKSLGWHNELTKEKIIREIKEMIYNFQLRNKVVEKQQTLIDGKGTERVVSEFIKILVRNGG